MDDYVEYQFPRHRQVIVLALGNGQFQELSDECDERYVGTGLTRMQRIIWAARLRAFAQEMEAFDD